MHIILCQDVNQTDRWFIASGFGNAVWPDDTAEGLTELAEQLNTMWTGRRVHKVFELIEVNNDIQKIG